ncbi:MAG: VOC family protein [Acidimicrobiales bacterium]
MGIHIDHISLLVHDLDEARADWEEILSVLSPGHLEKVTEGEGADATDGVLMQWCTFQSPDPTGVSIQLWAAGEEGTWVDKVLAKKGEYVHHVAFCATDFDGMIGDIKAKGLPLVLDEHSHPDSQPWLKWNFIPPAKAHGPLLELATRYLAVGDQWLPHPDNAENTEIADDLVSRYGGNGDAH